MALKNIRDFFSSVNTEGVLKKNKFLVTVPKPQGLAQAGWGGHIDDLLMLRCESAQIPGMSFASADGPPRLGYGPVERVPYTAIFEDVTLEFLIDTKSWLHNFFHDWVNLIFNFNGEGMDSVSAKNGPTKAAEAYEVGYKDSYAVDLKITMYDDKLNKTMEVTAYKAFPMGFPSQTLTWSDGELLRINIPFAYTDYRIQYAKKSYPKAPLLTAPSAAEYDALTGPIGPTTPIFTGSSFV